MDEFELINNYFKKVVHNNPGALSLNDDVFFDKKNKVVLSVDTYNEGVHYINFKKPSLIIKKIIRSSISDLFCKGVKPKYFFISGSGDKKHFNKKNLNLIIKSLKEEQRKFKIKLSGGDTTKSKISSFTIISLGFSNKIIKRNNVKINDDIYVTGNLGDSYVGLNILKKKMYISKKLNNYFIKKYFQPNLPVALSKYLFKFANSSIDVSDGLYSDLNKLTNEQKVGFNLNVNKIPISKNLSNYLKNNNKNALNFIFKGDDYQILFTSSKKNRTYIKKLSKRINVKISKIGNILKSYRQRRIFYNNMSLNPSFYKGYSHKF